MALTAIVGLLVAGCGGGSSDGTTSEDEVATQIETACTKLSGYSVWLPEHLAKTGMSSDEAEPIVDDAEDEFRASLESLDPPADLKEPIERLEAAPGSARTPADLKAGLAEEQALYEEVGADRCAEGERAAILTLDGASVEGAYRKVGIPLPPHPEGW